MSVGYEPVSLLSSKLFGHLRQLHTPFAPLVTEGGITHTHSPDDVPAVGSIRHRLHVHCSILLLRFETKRDFARGASIKLSASRL